MTKQKKLILIINELQKQFPTADWRGRRRESPYDQPGHLLRRGHQLSVAMWTEAIAPLDLTAVQYASLNVIADFPGIDATRISELIHFDRSTLGDVLDRIENRGWIVREAVRSDKRKKTLWLTEEGKALLEKVNPIARSVQLKLFKPLSVADRKSFVRLMTRFIEAHAERNQNKD